MPTEDQTSLARKGVAVTRMEGSPMILLRAGGPKNYYVTMTTAETRELVQALEDAMRIAVPPRALPRFGHGESIDITGGVESAEYVRRGR